MSALLAMHAAVLCLVVADLGVRAARLRRLLPPAERPSRGAAVSINALGDTASAVTPARLGGEPARFVGLRRAGIPASASVVALGVERLVDLSLAFLIGGFVVLSFGGVPRGTGALLRRFGSDELRPWLIGVALLAMASLAAVSWWRRRRPVTARASLRQARHALRDVGPAGVAAAAALTLASIALRAAVLPVLLFGIARIPPGESVVGSFGMLYGQLVLPMPSGAGGVELGYVAWLGARLDAAALATTLLVWRLYTIGPAVLITGVSWFGARRRLAQAGAAVALLALSLLPRNGAAQGARIVPLDHWAYEEIRLLRERGLLEQLNPLAQPYHAGELAAALGTLDPDTLPAPAAEWVRALQREFTPPPPEAATRWGVGGQGGVHGSTGRRLEPLRHFGQEDAWPWWRVGGWIEHGPLAAETRLYGDTWLVEDPDGIDPGQRRGARGDHAYLRVSLPALDVTVGRFARNWGPIGSTGVMVSSVPTTYPQLGLDAQLGPIRLTSFVGELDRIVAMKRYLSGHQVTWRQGDLVIAIGETVLYSAPTASFSLRYLNPAEYLFFDANNEPDDLSVNLMLDARAWLRVGSVTLVAEGMIDDISANRPRAPTRYGARLEARWTPVAFRVAARLGYERASSYAYRSNRPEDGYRFLGRGLGLNYADYDVLAATADVFPAVRGLRLSVGGQLLRQGEGDLRVPFPLDYDVFLRSPAFHLGVVESTMRLRFAGRYRPLRYLWIAWDLGPNFITNRFNQEGVSETTFGGVLDIGVRFDLPITPS